MARLCSSASVMLSTLIFVSASAARNNYLNEIKSSCLLGSSPFSCVGYRALSALTNFLHEPHPPIQAGPASLVRIESNEREPENLGREKLNRSDESGVLKAGRYVVDQFSEWIGQHALMFTIPNSSYGPRLVIQEGDRFTDPGSEDEVEVEDLADPVRASKSHKKKKWALMIPLIGMMKFLMLKFLLVPIFFATMFVKKVALMAVIYLPSFLASLKICKKDSHIHYHHKSSYNDEYQTPVDYETTGYQYTGYDKEWSQRRNSFN